MKLQQLNENEIKIILSKEDLRELDLTIRTIDYNTTKTRKAMWEIFDRARAQTGFDAAKNRIYVKLYPLSDGGCEMYVSKLGSKNDIPFGNADTSYSVRRQNLRYAGGDYAFSFESFESLYCACKALKPISDSSLYLSGSHYILLLKKLKRTPGDLQRWNEFGEPLKTKYISAYLDEHCTLLCENNAVEKITCTT